MSENSGTSIDMHNRVTATELEQIVHMQLAALEKDPAAAGVIPPLMVWGAPGLGKSTIIRKVAEEFGIGFIDVRLAQREPVDVRGLPVPDRERKCVDWLVSGEWPREGKGILLFDELTAADRSLQVAAYELILDRRLGDLYKVPDHWYICAAGNRVDDAAVAATMSSALANRFMHVELTEDVEAWAHWAVRNNVHPAVIGFLRFRPECLLRQANENLERGWPTPRSWERVSVMLRIIPNARENETILRKVVYGLVGTRAGVEFVEYFRLNAEFDDVRRMMLDSSVPVSIPARIDRKYAFCAGLAYFLWRGSSEEEKRALLSGFYRISLKLTSDFASMVMCDAMTGCGVIGKDEAAGKLFHHPEYKKWAAVHGKTMRKTLKF